MHARLDKMFVQMSMVSKPILGRHISLFFNHSKSCKYEFALVNCLTLENKINLASLPHLTSLAV